MRKMKVTLHIQPFFRLKAVLVPTSIIILVLFAGCLLPSQKEIAWTMEGTVTIEEGHELKDTENLKLIAIYQGYDPEAKPGYGGIISIIVSNVDSVIEGGEFSLTIDLIDIEYNDTTYVIEHGDIIGIYIWDDLDDDDYPDDYQEDFAGGVTSEPIFALSAQPDSELFPRGAEVEFFFLDFPDRRGWVAGYRGFSDDYGFTNPDELVTEVENGDILTGVELSL
jgi:hypothetical protein